MSMTSSPTHASANSHERVELMEELSRLYENSSQTPISRRLRLLHKRYAWWTVVKGMSFLKRLIDFSAALLLLVALTPLFALVGLLIKLTDNGPVLFWQVRVGKWGREFPFPKFRSMITNVEKRNDTLPTQSHYVDFRAVKIKRDPRVTSIGRIIRKLSIDELPQLWCVLKGDMSLVGPRPPLPREVSLYSLSERRRLDVLPGLTCIWQVSGRGDVPFTRQVELDVEYIHSRSVLTDIKILLKTVPAVLLGKGAY